MAVPGFRLAGVARRLLHRGQIDGRGVGRGPGRTPRVPLPLQDAQGFAARYAHGLAGNSGDLDYAPKRTARETALSAVEQRERETKEERHAWPSTFAAQAE